MKTRMLAANHFAPAVRARAVDVRRWAMSRGRSVDQDALFVILAAKSGRGDDEPLDLWTRVGVYGHLWADTRNWCMLNGLLCPDLVPETLWAYLHHLVDGDLLDPSSDPLPALLEPLRCYGGLGPDGRRETWVPVACRCREH